MVLKNILDSLLGRTTLPPSSLEKLFSISQAGITMQTELNLNPSPVAGICFKPVESSRYEPVKTEIEELLALSSKDTGSRFRLETDEFRFTWVILTDPDFADLITGIHMISQTFIERGLGAYLLCAIFRFENSRPVFWVYSFKKGSFYPFIPGPGKTRDNAEEFRLRSLLERELPIENDPGAWYPLWGIPL